MDMVQQAVSVNPQKVPRPIEYRIGFWAALLTSLVTAISFAIAIATPPISGPNCRDECVTYPYTDVVSHVPRDYFWMYPAFALAPIFIVLLVCIQRYATADKKIVAQVGLSFGLIYATVIMVDYYVQFRVVEPSLLKGETDGLALFSQYNPHGIFIALEDLGYLMMSLALFFVGMVFEGRTRLETAVRWLFMGDRMVVSAALIILGLAYGSDLEYRFEVVAISINWIVLIIGGGLLGIVFKRKLD